MNFKKYINILTERFSVGKLEQSRSRSILLYLCFVLISTVLWCFLTFNNTITIDMQLPVSVMAKPADVRFLGSVPDTITVSVTDRGSAFVKYLFRNSPKLELKFSDYASGDDLFRVDATQLKKMIARQLGHSATISAVLPDNISVKYTDNPGKLVPVIVDIEVEPQLLYMQNGPVAKSVDSVTVFSDPATLASITEVYTYHIKAQGLTDTLRRKVAISPLRGAVVEPRAIEVVVPIEKMISQRKKVQISVRNVPDGVKMIVFPSTVEVSYRAPISSQKQRNDVTVVVDYNSVTNQSGNKVAVQMGEAPAVFQDFKLSVDSVEYIIEKQRAQ